MSPTVRNMSVNTLLSQTVELCIKVNGCVQILWKPVFFFYFVNGNNSSCFLVM